MITVTGHFHPLDSSAVDAGGGIKRRFRFFFSVLFFLLPAVKPPRSPIRIATRTHDEGFFFLFFFFSFVRGRTPVSHCAIISRENLSRIHPSRSADERRPSTTITARHVIARPRRHSFDMIFSATAVAAKKK